MTPVSSVGGLSAFIVVFFTGQAWNRFMAMYNLSMSLEGRIFDTMLLVENLLPRDTAWRVWRHLNAAHCLTYIGASAHYSESNLLLPLTHRYDLLTEDELQRIRGIGFAGGGATREVLSWIVTLIEQEMPPEHGEYRKQAVIDQILRFRSAQGSTLDYQDLPFPWIYVSFVSVVCIVYPLLFAVSCALSFDPVSSQATSWTNEVINYIAVLLNAAFFLGLNSIAAKFQDPFTNDFEDLSVLHFVRFMAEASAKILLRPKPAKMDAARERSMQEQRDWRHILGSAWAPDSDAPAAAGIDIRMA
jgi:hypothetical protein